MAADNPTANTAVKPETATAVSLVGKQVDRIDGPLKVTGRATYAYEYAEGGKAAYGYVLGAAITRGRIAGIDTIEAERAPGVLLLMTHRNAPPQAEFGPPVTPTVPEVFTRARPVLADDRVRYYDEPVALVVAETLEAARAAAELIKIRYEREAVRFDLHAQLGDAYRPQRTNAGFATDTAVGDFEGAFATAPVRVALLRLPVELAVALRAGRTAATIRIGRGRVVVENGVTADALVVIEGEAGPLLRLASGALLEELGHVRVRRA